MTAFIDKLYLTHKNFWSKSNLLLLSGSVVWFLSALVVQRLASGYVGNYATTTPVGDLLLDNLPTVNLDFFIIYSTLTVTLGIISLLVIHPKYLPFSLKALALFIIIRSFFFSLTHLGINLHQITLNMDSIGFNIYDFFYNAKNDLFFSGHVGVSFLFALIFWKEKLWRYVFFIISGIFGVSMILAHMHYSIDVFAASFITYSIFIIATKLFKKDFALLSWNTIA